MWNRVEEVVDDIRPLIRSVGVDAKVVDVIDRVVTVELSRTDEDSNPDLVRLRTFVAREIQAEMPEVREVVFEGELAPPPPKPARSGPDMRYDAPSAEADTVVLTFERPVAPPATTVYDDVAIAADRPIVLAILRLQGVVSVIGRAERLIVARAADAAWDQVLPAIEAAVGSAGGGVGADGLRERVETILDRDINPALSSHGGFIELLDVKGADLYIHMGGGCQGCAQSQATLRMGVERQIRDAIPEVGQIFDTTDHAAGENPYFRA